MGVGVLLDVGGSAVKVTAADLDGGGLLGSDTATLPTHRPDALTVEGDPATWWTVIEGAMQNVQHEVRRPISAVTVASLRQGYVLVGEGAEISPIVLNSDRRGRHQLNRLADEIGSDRLYDVTGHWIAPELTLPKLLHTAASQPQVWRRTTAVLSVHDWVVWRLTGVTMAARSVAGSSQLVDVDTGAWATDLLDELGLATSPLPKLVDAGVVVGRTILGANRDVTVVAGGGDTHVASTAVDGDQDGTVVIVAGSSTPLQATTATRPSDPKRHPWVGPHLAFDDTAHRRWAVETNAGYPGTALAWLGSVTGCEPTALAALARKSQPGANGITAVVGTTMWTEQLWAHRPEQALLGFDASHGPADVARAVVEGHAYAIRGNLQDLERSCGRRSRRVMLTGGAAANRWFTQLVADVVGRPIDVPAGSSAAARATCKLLGGSVAPVAATCVEPEPDPRYDDGYARFTDGFAAARAYSSFETHGVRQLDGGGGV